MAVEITVIATDRQGRRIDSRVVEGANYAATQDDRIKAFESLKAAHRDSEGIEPYLFTKIISK